jgi:aspartate aminotransferase
MLGARGVAVKCGPADHFLPTAADLREGRTSRTPRLLCLNSPLNPTGTAISAGALSGICELVLAENARREPAASARST